MSRQENMRRLVNYYHRRLQKLREEEAIKGFNTPPEVLMEIEDIEARLESLAAEFSVVTQPEATSGLTDEAIAQELARLSGSPAQSVQIGGINIQGVQGSTIHFGGDVSANVEAGGDIVAGNKTITHSDPAAALAVLQTALTQWQQAVEAKLAALTNLEDDEKEEVKEKAARVETEMIKGDEANLSRVERLLNSISAMAPDILEVTAKILQSPFKGVGLVLEKIGDRIKLVRQK